MSKELPVDRTGYIIDGGQEKMKISGPLFKNYHKFPDSDNRGLNKHRALCT